LRQNGNGDLLDLSDIQIQRNGAKVSTSAAVNGKDVTFLLNDTVKDGALATYYVYAKVNNVQNNSGDTYQFSLRNTTDLNAIEILNGFRSTVNGGSGSVSLNTYTINGGDLVFERDTTVALSNNYAKGTSRVTLLKGKVTAKSPVTLEDLTLAYTTNVGSNTGAAQAFDTVYAKIGSSTMTWSPATSGAATAAVFYGLASINGTADIEIYAKLKDSATATSFKFDDVKLSSFAKKEYVSNQNTVQSSVGSVG